MHALDIHTASRFARITLGALEREFPFKPEHVINSALDVRLPREVHPAFFGSFDWHSAVHGHWMLVRLLAAFPALPEADEIRSLLSAHLSAANIAAEVAYLGEPNRATFGRTYGWAWLLKLALELHECADPNAASWRANLDPLAEAMVARYLDFLPRQDFPIRHGVHANTAFGLGFALDYARAANQRGLAGLIEERARTYFLHDVSYPAAWEPSGADFLSGALTEADLMRRVLPGEAFSGWLAAFLPGLAQGEPAQLMRPVRVRDRHDLQLVHLDGLNLSRAWAMRNVALALSANDPLRPLLLSAAGRHAAAGLEHVASGDYAGEHWLATFAVYLQVSEVV